MSAHTEPTGPDRDGPGKLSRTDTLILEALRARGAQTIEQLESSVSGVSRAHVLNADQEITFHQLQAGFQQELLSERIAHLRGVRVSRIFVLTRDDLRVPDIRKTIVQQRDDGIHVRLALWEDLTFLGREGIDLPTNFVIFDQGEVMVRTPLLGLYYGKKTRVADDVARFERIFCILDQHARPALDVLGQALSGEAGSTDQMGPVVVKQGGTE